MSTLQTSKEFQCSKENLYRAWTDPDQLKQWWKPLGKELGSVENDIREGGTVKYAVQDNSLTIDGNYEKVIEQELLEYTWNWHVSSDVVEDTAYKLSVHFEGDDNQSKISISQDGFKSEESIQPHQTGWEQGLEQLNSFLSGQQQSSQSQEGGQQSGGSQQQEGLQAEKPEYQDQKAPVSGYNETPEQVKVGGG